jgi:hypothetical protein
MLPIASEYKKQYAAIIIGAIILVLSLIWRDVLLSAQEKIFPGKNNFLGDLTFAVIITGVAVLAIVFFRKSLNLDDNL